MSIGSLLALSKISDHTTIAERGAGHSIITDGIHQNLKNFPDRP